MTITDSSRIAGQIEDEDKKDDEAARLIFQLKSKRCTTAKNVFAQGRFYYIFVAQLNLSFK